MKIATLTPRFVEEIPEHLDDGVLYVCEQYKVATHRCCCGCGEEVVTPLSPVEWTIRRSGNRVSVWPSIGNWDFACRSHYVIRENRVLPAKGFTERQVEAVKARDKADKAAYLAVTNRAKEAQHDAVSASPAPACAAEPQGWIEGLRRFGSWLVRLIGLGK